MRAPYLLLILPAAALGTVLATSAAAQPLGEPDRGQPGDRMIQDYLRRETARIEGDYPHDFASLQAWQANLPRYREEYFHMLGLWPLPEKTPLEATITGKLEGDGYVVEMLHYQSRPRLYVTANLYRPAEARPGQRFPAVLYVCGHSGRGRDGNKTAYQSHGIWFARHGYVCLVVDTLQLGEIAAVHHGTYREERWWWHSRGYTPAGVECWNGVRGIDYLISRPDVDAERIAVTGISGGGAATFWIAAADERVKVAVPVSGMADLESYVPNRVINGHCDCMFLYNTFQWPWTRIAGLIAPRPLLFVNSDQDPIFPMDANERIINGLERLYSLFGSGDRVDAVVSIGGHAYREDIRQAAFRFINTWLKDDPRPVTDSEELLVAGPRSSPEHPIAPERLRVFPSDSDIPRDELNTTIDEHFVPVADVKLPEEGEFEPWKAQVAGELRRVVFRYFPERIPPARLVEELDAGERRMESEPGIEFRLHFHQQPEEPKRLLLIVGDTQPEALPPWAAGIVQPNDLVAVCVPRGLGATQWTRKNPPNYVERSHVLLGRTVDTGRVWDVAAAAHYLIEQAANRGGKQGEKGAAVQLHVAGEGGHGLIAAYAALFEPDIAAATLVAPPATHMDTAAPQFLNVLRVCDVPSALGLLAPRPLTILGAPGEITAPVEQAYQAAGAPKHLRLGDQP